MNKHVILVCFLAAVALAKPAPQQQDPPGILKYDNNVDINGYDFAFETADGISRQEKGVLENPESENPILKVQGSYSYTAPDGKQYRVEFTADENGFQPHTTLQRKK